MSLKWKLFRIVCILQMLIASAFTIMGVIHFFKYPGFSSFIAVILYLVIFLQTVLAVNIINNNYPNVPVTGTQKTNFNRLYLLNFLFLVFLFGMIFAEYRELNQVSVVINKPLFELPVEMFYSIISDIVVLVFQFIILYGLYELRRELYFNFMKKQFDFEKDQAL
jgi:hypothetical protein